MNKNLIDISKTIDTSFVSVYELLVNAAHKEQIPFIVIGASARDLILEHCYKIKTGRITQDIDIAIQVSTWKEFEKLKTALLETNKIKHTRTGYRLFHETSGLYIDIIPFGQIEKNTHTISWPPEYEIKLNVLGFQDAIKNTQIIRLRNNPTLEIAVANIPSLVLLKIIAWKDRFPNSSKDALDLAFILRNYLRAGNEEQLSGHHQDLLDVDNFDTAQVGARLLGRNIAKIVSENTKNTISEILENETRSQNRYALAEDMTREQYIDDFEKNLSLLVVLRLGFTE